MFIVALFVMKSVFIYLCIYLFFIYLFYFILFIYLFIYFESVLKKESIHLLFPSFLPSFLTPYTNTHHTTPHHTTPHHSTPLHSTPLHSTPCPLSAYRKKPSALEYFSYMLNFHSLLAGPFFMFADYQDFVEGTNYAKRALHVAGAKVRGRGGVWKG